MTDNYSNDNCFQMFLLESFLQSCIDSGKKRMAVPTEVVSYMDMATHFVMAEMERQERFNNKFKEDDSERH